MYALCSWCVCLQSLNVPLKSRRKRSLSENWLEHKPATTVDNGEITVIVSSAYVPDPTCKNYPCTQVSPTRMGKTSLTGEGWI